MKTFRSKFVLIHDKQIVDIYETYDDALREGFLRFSGIGFLARKIEEPPKEAMELCVELR